MPGFLSASTYQSTWLSYQHSLCDALNASVTGTPYEALPVRELHETLSRRPADAALYNIAAQAHHNHFFWNTLSSLPNPPPPSRNFQSDIEEYFESLNHLRIELTDAALSIFGSGYVWLMKDLSMTHNLRILCTYNAGSPFPAAHSRRQSFDHSTGGNTLSSALSRPQNTVGSIGEYSSNRPHYHQGSLKALPILCLKVWEHQWLPDYGINGKESYVKNWFDRIDWDEVLNLYNLVPEDANELYHASRRGIADGSTRPTANAGASESTHALLREAQRSMPLA